MEETPVQIAEPQLVEPPVQMQEQTVQAVQMCGGFGGGRIPSDDEIAMLLNLKGDVEDRTGKSFPHFSPTSVSTQVVAGTNFAFQVSTDVEDASKLLRVTIFKPLPHSQQPPRVTSVSE